MAIYRKAALSIGVASLSASLLVYFIVSSTGAGAGPGEATTMCISAQSAQGSRAALAQVRAVLPDLKASYETVIARKSQIAPEIDWPAYTPPSLASSCPEPFSLPPVAGGPPELVLRQARMRVVQPGAFNIHIVVAAADMGQELIGARGWAVGPYEEACEYDACREVSTALYVSEPTLADRVALRKALEMALGWASLVNYPNGHPSSEDANTK
jgi:hypothetical protein